MDKTMLQNELSKVNLNDDLLNYVKHVDEIWNTFTMTWRNLNTLNRFKLPVGLKSYCSKLGQFCHKVSAWFQNVIVYVQVVVNPWDFSTELQ
jgi:hypothetical protein